MLKQNAYSKVVDVNEYSNFHTRGFVVKKVAKNFKLFVIET